MATQILATKLYIPPSRPATVQRPNLIERLNTGLYGRLTLISAPAGFGKTTLVTEWINAGAWQVAWLSLDDDDSDPVRFLTYVIAALQTTAPQIGTGILSLLDTPQPPPTDTLLTQLLNEMASIPHDFVLVLDDYHVLDNQALDANMAFLIDNQPPQMHLVITTREDPRLPLARLRARGQLTEIRAADLRFTADEAAEFLNQAMGLSLTAAAVEAIEQRTEGWIAGLQLAAISMQGLSDIGAFITSFTGSHHFVVDYLIEEVLHHQPPHIQDFLLKTSILERMCGALCDAVLQDTNHAGADMLESIRQANLFVIPLDNQRHWYRYHHLFGDLLRKRLSQSTAIDVNTLHSHASAWYAANGFEVEAFQHAALAGDIERAEHLISRVGVPLYFRSITLPVLRWLERLTTAERNARPSLWVIYAWTLMAAHQNTQIEQTLQAAEAALADAESDAYIRDLWGQIAAIRAMEAALTYQVDTIIAQAHRALDLLDADNLHIRTAVTRSLAIAYQFRGDRQAARDSYQKAIAMSEASDNLMVNVLATTGLGIIQLSDNQLYEAAESFQRVIDLVGDPELPITCVAHLRLARIYYEWNDLEVAQDYGERGVRLAQKIEGIDSAAGGQIFLARLKLAQGDIAGASAALDHVEQIIHQRGFAQQIPTLAAARVDLYLQMGRHTQAASLANAHDLPLSQARAHLAGGDPQAAINLITPYRKQMAEKGWHDDYTKATVIASLAYHQSGDTDQAIAQIHEVLAAVASAGFVRTFVDEGKPMQQLLAESTARGVMPDYTHRLLAAFQTESGIIAPSPTQPLIEPLSERELEILALVAVGLSNRQISERLYIALNTVKGHNRNIFAKLQVDRRTEAVARARELGLVQ